MKRIPVSKVEGETYCYESEDIEKVTKAFEVLFPKKMIAKSVFDGGFGTKIIVLKAEAKDKKAREITSKVFSSMEKNEKENILKKIALHIDEEGKFYLRIDKQLAYEKEKIKSCTSEESSIKLIFKLEAYPAKMEGYINSAEILLKT